MILQSHKRSVRNSVTRTRRSLCNNLKGSGLQKTSRQNLTANTCESSPADSTGILFFLLAYFSQTLHPLRPLGHDFLSLRGLSRAVEFSLRESEDGKMFQDVF